MRKFQDLTLDEKIFIKAYAMSIFSKRWHTAKPDYLNKLNELQVLSILGRRIINIKN